jgi:hypothetical protein
MLRATFAFILLILFIGIVALGMWLILGHGEETTQLPATSHTPHTVEPDTGGGSNALFRSRGAKRPLPTTEEVHHDAPPRELAVSDELASELKLTEAEQERINTLVDEIRTDRRQLFDELSERGRTVEEVSEEMSDLRQQLHEDIEVLLGDERAAAVLDALRRRN